MMRRIIVSILIICVVFACKATDDAKEGESKEIVFVCTHGAARSPIAAAYFNKLAEENDLNYHAVFRGTEPDAELSKGAVRGLTADGFNTDSWKPSKVSHQDVEKAHKLVTFDCSAPSTDDAGRIIEWNGTPSISENYITARDVIKGHVQQLIEVLKDE